MLTKYLIEEQTLTDIADSIREKEGSNDTILVNDYADRVRRIDPSSPDYAFIIEYCYYYPKVLDYTALNDTDINLCERLINNYLEREGIQ